MSNAPAITRCPKGIGYWYGDPAGVFYAGVEAYRDVPAFCGRFAGGAGCDPATIADADIGLVAWHMTYYSATVTMLSFAATLRDARREFIEASEIEDDLARKAADPHPPGDEFTPWWALPPGEQGQYAAEQAARHEGDSR